MSYPYRPSGEGFNAVTNTMLFPSGDQRPLPPHVRESLRRRAR